jgi:hypothetical protein
MLRADFLQNIQAWLALPCPSFDGFLCVCDHEIAREMYVPWRGSSANS